MAYQHPLKSTRNLYEMAYRALRVRGEVYREATQQDWARHTRNLEMVQKNHPAIYWAAVHSYGSELEYGHLRLNREPMFPRFYAAMKQQPVEETRADYFHEWWDMGF